MGFLIMMNKHINMMVLKLFVLTKNILISIKYIVVPDDSDDALHY